MPEIRIDRTNSGRRLLIILSKEREDAELSKPLIKVAMNTAITFSIETVPNPSCGQCKKFLEKVCVIAVDNL